MSYSLFAVGETRRLRQNGQERRRIKGKSAALPDIPSERSESSPLFFAVQRRKARREEEESVRYLKRRFVKRPGTIPPRAATTGFDGVLITKTTTFEQSWNGAKKSQLHAIGNSHERASSTVGRLTTLINPDRQNSGANT